jgi:AbrB family looped-hinge helix DNA binding protein
MAQVGPGGRVVIPAAYRKALGIRAGDEVIVAMEEGELRISTLKQAVARAQAMVRRYVPRGRSLVKELLRERREEAKRE